MTDFVFSTLSDGQQLTFDATADTLTLTGTTASAVSVQASGSNVTISSGGKTVTLLSTSLTQLTSSNIVIAGTNNGVVRIGDNTTDASLDAAPNQINLGTDDNNNLIMGAGGVDDIDVGNGDNLIFGGLQGGDPSDSGDTINLGNAAAPVGSNTVFGNGGADAVTFDVADSATSVNQIFLGADNDTLTDAANILGTITAYGGLGNDTITLDGTQDTANFVIYGGNFANDTSDGADTITVRDGSGTIFGRAGNDTISVANGADLSNGESVDVRGNAGDDSITIDMGDGSSATLAGGLGNDTIDATDAEQDASLIIYGDSAQGRTEDGNDTISWGESNGAMYGRGGNDTLNVGQVLASTSGTIAMSVFGGLGNDTVSVSGNQDGATISIKAGGGNDVINVNAATFANNVSTIQVTDFSESDDVMNVSLDASAAVTAYTLSGLGSSVVLSHTAGTNHDQYLWNNFTGSFNGTNLVIGDGTQKLLTNASTTATTLTGGTTTDLIVSGDAGDTLVSGGGVDKLIGNAGDDVFQISGTQAAGFNGTQETLTGGNGTDTLALITAAGTLADADFGDTTAGNGDVEMSSIEAITLGDFNGFNITLAANAKAVGIASVDASALTGTNAATINAGGLAQNVTITGGNGADVITVNTANGAQYSDSATGGAGDDSITIFSENLTANDTLAGGAGTDKLILDNSGADTLASSVFGNVSGVEELEFAGLAAGMNLTLGSEAQTAGIVTVDGAAAGQALVIDASAYTTNITVTAHTANDSITGGTGADTIDAGDGTDTVIGGVGNDRIVFNAAGDSDVVIFNTTNGTDVIDGAEADLFGAGDTIFTFDASEFGLATTTESVQTSASFAAQGTNGNVLIDTAGQHASVTAAAAAIAGNANITDTVGFFLYSDSTDNVAKLVHTTDLAGDGTETVIATFEDLVTNHTDLSDAVAANFNFIA